MERNSRILSKKKNLSARELINTELLSIEFKLCSLYKIYSLTIKKQFNLISYLKNILNKDIFGVINVLTQKYLDTNYLFNKYHEWLIEMFNDDQNEFLMAEILKNINEQNFYQEIKKIVHPILLEKCELDFVDCLSLRMKKY